LTRRALGIIVDRSWLAAIAKRQGVMDAFLGIAYAVSSDALGTLLVYSALTKILDLTGFKVLLHGYSVIPKSWISIVARAVP